ncbi:hypothetical protein [Streptomyces albus]|uniref:hypothetical protein n=1 Tax=Streptomyces albus TaxID=1888 RepID=UPI0004C6B4FC|nr:hypothetical protein [Streptomyces albus]
MDIVVYLLVPLLMLVGWGIERRIEQTGRRIARLERKVDLMMEQLGIPEADPGLDRVRALVRDGKRVEAVRAYRRHTGAGLKEAVDEVDRLGGRP